MTTLAAFLLARLDEDESVARAASNALPEFAGVDGLSNYGSGSAYDEMVSMSLNEGTSEVCGAHARRHDPARALAEVAAKRAIVEQHGPVDYSGLGMEDPGACSACGADLGMGDWEWNRGSYPCHTLRHLASVYADHPDYDEAWRP